MIDKMKEKLQISHVLPSVNPYSSVNSETAQQQSTENKVYTSTCHFYVSLTIKEKVWSALPHLGKFKTDALPVLVELSDTECSTDSEL